MTEPSFHLCENAINAKRTLRQGVVCCDFSKWKHKTLRKLCVGISIKKLEKSRSKYQKLLIFNRAYSQVFLLFPVGADFRSQKGCNCRVFAKSLFSAYTKARKVETRLYAKMRQVRIKNCVIFPAVFCCCLLLSCDDYLACFHGFFKAFSPFAVE